MHASWSGMKTSLIIVTLVLMEWWAEEVLVVSEQQQTSPPHLLPPWPSCARRLPHCSLQSFQDQGYHPWGYHHPRIYKREFQQQIEIAFWEGKQWHPSSTFLFGHLHCHCWPVPLTWCSFRGPCRVEVSSCKSSLASSFQALVYRRNNTHWQLNKFKKEEFVSYGVIFHKTNFLPTWLANICIILKNK